MRNALRVLAVVALAIPTMASADISLTKHNLSITGTAGNIKFDASVASCQFCHVVHNASTMAALWARGAGTGTGYTTTTTTAGTALPATPSAATRKCLGCHDGTVALNQVVTSKGTTTLAGAYSGPVGAVTAGFALATTSTAQMGSLEGQHPVGIPYAGQTNSGTNTVAGYQPVLTSGCDTGIPVCVSNAATEGTKIKLFGVAANYTVECASCHEPHESTNAKFLRVATAANRCSACHIK
jgi:predicted CXXCH cytochrome family protein